MNSDRPEHKYRYLDNAATSWPKPESVINEICRFYRDIGAAAHRGSGSRSTEVDRTIEQCRFELAKLVNADQQRLFFCFNGTDGLNLAINGLVTAGDHLVTSQMEHNSVLRPFFRHSNFQHSNFQHSNQPQVEIKIARCVDGQIDLTDIEKHVSNDTRLCCVSHVSNVTGIVQPIKKIADICHDRNVLLMVDAAQSVGHMPVDFQQLGCDILIAPGHKGLLGPLGTGFVCLTERAAEQMSATRIGGTGTQSESIQQPNDMPARFESGNLNVGGIFGLLAGVRFLQKRGVEEIADHERQLANRLIERLQQIDCLQLYVGAEGIRSGVVSFNIIGQDAQIIAGLLESSFDIHVRAGLHCAPLIHDAIGSKEFGGTIRVSPGVFNTIDDIEFVGDSIEKLCAQLV